MSEHSNNECLCPPEKKNIEVYQPESLIEAKTITGSKVSLEDAKSSSTLDAKKSGSTLSPKKSGIKSVPSAEKSTSKSVKSVRSAERPSSKLLKSAKSAEKPTLKSIKSVPVSEVPAGPLAIRPPSTVGEEPGTGVAALKKAVSITINVVVIIVHAISVGIQYPSRRMASWCREKYEEEASEMYKTLSVVFNGLADGMDHVNALFNALQNYINQKLDNTNSSE